jgi:hypothetical protein
MLSEVLEADPAMTNESKQAIMRETLDLDTLMAPAVADSTQLCRQIKDTMVLIGLTPGDDNRRKRLVIRIAEGLHEDSAFASESERLLEENRRASQPAARESASGSSAGPAAGSSASAVAHGAGNQSNLFQIAKAMSSRYSESSKYSGVTNETVNLPFSVFRSSYMTAIQELDVPREYHASLLHHALRGPALDYFYECLSGKVTQIGEALKILEDKFLGASVKLEIRTRLLSLRLAEIQKEKDLTKIEAIEDVRRIIYNLSQQGQPEYRTSAAMIDVLEKSVLVDEPWSVDIAARRATYSFTFDEYCTALTSWIRAKIEKNGTRNPKGYFGKPSESSSAQLTQILYGEQYNKSTRRASHRDRRHNSMSQSAFPSRPKPAYAPKKGNCHRCGKPGHWMSECRSGGVSHLDALQARVKDAGGGSAGTARVLFELGAELDAAEAENSQTRDSDSEENEDDAEAASAFEQFFQVENTGAPSDFRPSRA